MINLFSNVKPIWPWSPTKVFETIARFPIDFVRVARLRVIATRGGSDPIENWPTNELKVNWEHYARVLEAKEKANKL